MIRRLLRPLFALLLVALSAARGHAETARSTDLFEGLDSIRLSAAVGGALDLEGSTTPQLFEGDLRRFNRFKHDLTQALSSKLSTCGLFVDDAAPDELSVEVFGRLEELPQCAPRYVFMIQVRVMNSKLKAGKGKVEPLSLSPVIGLADEAGLERTLIETAVAAIARELRSCSG